MFNFNKGDLIRAIACLVAYVVFMLDLVFVFSHTFLNGIKSTDVVSVVLSIGMVVSVFLINVMVGIILVVVFGEKHKEKQDEQE